MSTISDEAIELNYVHLAPSDSREDDFLFISGHAVNSPLIRKSDMHVSIKGPEVPRKTNGLADFVSAKGKQLPRFGTDDTFLFTNDSVIIMGNAYNIFNGYLSYLDLGPHAEKMEPLITDVSLNYRLTGPMPLSIRDINDFDPTDTDPEAVAEVKKLHEMIWDVSMRLLSYGCQVPDDSRGVEPAEFYFSTHEDGKMKLIVTELYGGIGRLDQDVYLEVLQKLREHLQTKSRIPNLFFTEPLPLQTFQHYYVPEIDRKQNILIAQLEDFRRLILAGDRDPEVEQVLFPILFDMTMCLASLKPQEVSLALASGGRKEKIIKIFNLFYANLKLLPYARPSKPQAYDSRLIYYQANYNASGWAENVYAPSDYENILEMDWKDISLGSASLPPYIECKEYDAGGFECLMIEKARLSDKMSMFSQIRSLGFEFDKKEIERFTESDVATIYENEDPSIDQALKQQVINTMRGDDMKAKFNLFTDPNPEMWKILKSSFDPRTFTKFEFAKDWILPESLPKETYRINGIEFTGREARIFFNTALEGFLRNSEEIETHFLTIKDLRLTRSFLNGLVGIFDYHKDLSERGFEFISGPRTFLLWSEMLSVRRYLNEIFSLGVPFQDANLSVDFRMYEERNKPHSITLNQILDMKAEGRNYEETVGVPVM